MTTRFDASIQGQQYQLLYGPPRPCKPVNPPMIDQRTLEDWLNSANARYRAEEIPPRQRPFRALSDFSRDFKCSFTLDSPIAKSIIDWFYKHSAPGSHAIGSMFTGAFYFDAYFWPMHIPIGYGTFSINAFDCLETMPEAVKEHLAKNQQDSTNLAACRT